MITGRTRVFGLLGYPIHHSLSPAMHNELFRRARVDAVYVALPVRPADADQVAPAIRALGLGGVNLTVPFKERVVPALDGLSPRAEAAGAVNVVIADGAKLVGDNTDGHGYVEALRAELGIDPRGLRAAVLGAGGAGRAVGAALAEAGAVEITLFNRTLGRAEAAAESFAARFPATRFDARPLLPAAFDAPFDLVINCTSGEGAAAVAALGIARLPRTSTWTDTNYWMADPPQLAACAARGIRIQRGIGMLVHQGALSFERFTGVAVSPDAVRGVLDLGGW